MAFATNRTCLYRGKEYFREVKFPSGPMPRTVLSETPLERICGQHIYSTFLANVVDKAVGERGLDGVLRN